MPLENTEWKAIINMKWRALIKKTYDDIIDLVGSLMHGSY